MNERLEVKRKKNIKSKASIYHFYYKKKGVYSFLIKNVFKVGLALIALAFILYLLNTLLPDFQGSVDRFINKFDTFPVLSIFFISESFLGIIPPDIFIVWAQKFSQPYLIVTVLALLSYLGGVCSYFLGKYIGQIPKINRWLQGKFIEHFDKIRKWGGVLIIFAALFPLPFSPVCIVAGMVRFPIPAFLLLATFRWIRFFAYAVVLFKLF